MVKLPGQRYADTDHQFSQTSSSPASKTRRDEPATHLARKADRLFTALGEYLVLMERHVAGRPALMELLTGTRALADEGIQLMAEYLPMPSEWKNAYEVSEEAHPILAAPRQVLVVEWDTVSANIASTSLKKGGHTVVLCPDGPSALIATEGSSKIDLMFAEIALPGMSGIELADKVALSHPRLSILLTTADTTVALSAAAKRYPFIPKPYTGDQLMHRVARMIA